VVALPAAAAEPPVDSAPDSFEIRQRSWLKRLLPQGTFGRSLLLIVMPLVLVQIIAVWVFFARHWETVSTRLSQDVAGDIGLVIDAMKFAHTELELTGLLENASALTNIDFVLERGAGLTPEVPEGSSLFEEQLRDTLRERVGRPYRIDAVSDPRYTRVLIELPAGVLAADVPRKRLSTYTTSVFILWMIGSSLIFLSVAALFLRNQVKSLRRLAAAAEGFGKGRPVPFSKVEGALEVRQAGVAFIQMRERIRRQIRQRGEMLAGVGGMAGGDQHDARRAAARGAWLRSQRPAGSRGRNTDGWRRGGDADDGTRASAPAIHSPRRVARVGGRRHRAGPDDRQRRGA